MSDDNSTDCRQWSNEKYDRALKFKLCMCGSEEPRHALYDARGIFLTNACSKCEKEKLSHYRPDVLTDSQYWTDEDVDGDE